MPQIKEVYVRWIGIFILAYLIKFINGHPSDNPFWLDYFFSLVFTAIYWNVLVFFFMLYRKKFPGIRYTSTRLILNISTIILLVFIANPLIRLSLGLITFEQITHPTVLFEFMPMVIFVSFMVGSMYENFYFYEKWKNTVHLNESLKSQQIKTQFEVLQNQMSPHFLFNNLNTLTTLISENPQIAQKFTEKLSEVYRYILQNKEREIVPLYEEIEFCNSYIYLLEMRYPENLHIKFDLPESLYSKHIAPLTLQMLIENAIKHNAISKNHPLYIHIYCEKDNILLVKNNLQTRKLLDKSTGTGLDNIEKRYQLLLNKGIEVIHSKDNFTVAIPLISVVNERNYQEDKELATK